jgi:hypothetical protein
MLISKKVSINKDGLESSVKFLQTGESFTQIWDLHRSSGIHFRWKKKCCQEVQSIGSLQLFLGFFEHRLYVNFLRRILQYTRK